jgi:hypothetical protein
MLIAKVYIVPWWVTIPFAAVFLLVVLAIQLVTRHNNNK